MFCKNRYLPRGGLLLYLNMGTVFDVIHLPTQASPLDMPRIYRDMYYGNDVTEINSGDCKHPANCFF